MVWKSALSLRDRKLSVPADASGPADRYPHRFKTSNEDLVNYFY